MRKYMFYIITNGIACFLKRFYIPVFIELIGVYQVIFIFCTKLPHNIFHVLIVGLSGNGSYRLQQEIDSVDTAKPDKHCIGYMSLFCFAFPTRRLYCVNSFIHIQIFDKKAVA